MHWMCGGVCDMIAALKWMMLVGAAYSLMEVITRLDICIIMMRLNRIKRLIKEEEERHEETMEAIEKLKDK